MHFKIALWSIAAISSACLVPALVLSDSSSCTASIALSGVDPGPSPQSAAHFIIAISGCDATEGEYEFTANYRSFKNGKTLTKTLTRVWTAQHARTFALTEYSLDVGSDELLDSINAVRATKCTCIA